MSMAGGNTLRTNLSMGYESFNVRTGLTQQVPASNTSAAEGGVSVAPAGEQFTPSGSGDQVDRAEEMLLRWTQADTTQENLGGSAQIARDVGFEVPEASSQADPGGLSFLTPGLDFESGGIGNNLLSGNSSAPTERAPQAQHDGWLIS